VLKTFLLILVATALPEEILFRALIQNSLMRKLGFTNRTLLLAALIFGCSHLNNGPGPLPNWRYAIMATIAGFAYGKVFEKSSSVFSSAILHALINTSKHIFF
jgi:membrane protease YdiL (CAAX protease family)